AFSVWAGWERTEATIADSRLCLSLGYADVSYEMDGLDRVVGTFTRSNGSVTLGLFTRLDASRLTSPYILSTWEIPGERVYIPHDKAIGTGPIKLALRLSRRENKVSAPREIFNHGSVIGKNRPDSFSLLGEARGLLEKGFRVLVPRRGGGGLSEGVYGENTYGTSH